MDGDLEEPGGPQLLYSKVQHMPKNVSKNASAYHGFPA